MTTWVTAIGRHVTPPPPRACLAWACLALAAAAQGCALSPDTPGEPLPTLADLRAARGRTHPAETARHDPVRTGIRRIDLPIDAPIKSAWDMLGSGSLPAERVELWRRNGLRIGVLPAARRGAFYGALRPVTGRQHRVVVGGGVPVSLAASRRSLGEVKVFLEGAEDTMRVVEIREGEAQLLLRVLSLEQGDRFLEVVPHHHVPTRTFFQHPDARYPNARSQSDGHTPIPDLEGTLFGELSVTVAIKRGEVLVIGPWAPGLTREAPTAKNPRRADPQASEGSATQEMNTESSPTSGLTLGRAILLAQRLGHPIQTIYLIERPAR